MNVSFLWESYVKYSIFNYSIAKEEIEQKPVTKGKWTRYIT